MAFDVNTNESSYGSPVKADSRNMDAGLQSKQLVGVLDLILFLLCGLGSGTLIMHSFLS